MFFTVLIYAGLVLFILLVIGFWFTNLVGLPGNWGIVVLALAWIFIGPPDYRFGWSVVVALAMLAIIGEAIEFAASIFGTKKLGGSTRGASLSVVGSIVGGLVGAVFGIPIPIPLVGILIGSILFAAIGAWVGATIGEKWEGKPMAESVKIGGAAFIGRLLGTAGKLVLGSTMVVLAIASLFLFNA
ncbi:MAG: DUF456 family protein [Mariniblastus sp.]